jgi:hypothetical protein
MSNPAFEFDHIHIISQNPHDLANWYVEMFGADIVNDTEAYGAPQIFMEIGGKTLIIRGQRAGEAPTARVKRNRGPSPNFILWRHSYKLCEVL